MIDTEAIRWRALDRVELDVVDLRRSLRFYRDVVGLREDGAADGGVAMRPAGGEGTVVLRGAPAAGLRRIGWTLQDDRQLDALHDRLAARGVAFEATRVADRRARGFVRTIGFVDPCCGASHDCRVVPAAVDPPLARAASPQPADPLPGASQQARIQRLGHVVLATPRHAEAVAFFRDVLGFRESDRIAGGTTFLRPHPSPFHHGLGVGRSTRPRFHHLNFMVTDIDDIGRALHRLHRDGVPVVFGPGRHPASGSVFLYFLDPDGLTLEYSFGMEEFAETDARPARDYPGSPRSVDAWGGVRDPRMGAVGEIAAAPVLGRGGRSRPVASGAGLPPRRGGPIIGS
jgi:2,3-dihydroxy-p-cumate/2,3-dihydroxybenzoate 3,4-dioxygenase